MTKDVRAAFLACALYRLPMFASDMKGAPDGVEDEAGWNRKARERAAKREIAAKRKG